MTQGGRAWLFDELRMRYEHPFEVGAYSRQVKEGLLAEESAIIERISSQPCPALVLGCGAGREVFALARAGYAVTGADISQSMLHAARRMESRQLQLSPREERDSPTAWVWMEDPLNIPLVDHSFSLVIAFAQLLSHIPGRDARVSLLKEVRRVLRPGGRFIATYTDRHLAADLLKSDDEEAASDEAFERDRGDDASDEAFRDLERAAGWEEGDIFVWNPSEAPIEEPLFFHLHTRFEVRAELQAAGLRDIKFHEPRKLTPHPAEDAHRYPFVVACRSDIA